MSATLLHHKSIIPSLTLIVDMFFHSPLQSVSSGEWWYYNIEMGFYLSLVVSQFFDIQRKVIPLFNDGSCEFENPRCIQIT